MLGAQLLSRTPRKLVPTEAGRAFHAHCETLMAEVSGRLEAAHTEIQQLSAGTAGTLRLLSDPQFSTTFVCHVTRLFLEQHPNVHCQLDVVGKPHSPAVGEVDCYVCAELPDLPNLVGKQLGRLSYGLYASPAYLARQGTPDAPGQLAQHASIVSRDAPAGDAIRLHSKSGTALYLPRPNIVTNDYWILKTFCIDGFGIALMPDFFAQPRGQAPDPAAGAAGLETGDAAHLLRLPAPALHGPQAARLRRPDGRLPGRHRVLQHLRRVGRLGFCLTRPDKPPGPWDH